MATLTVTTPFNLGGLSDVRAYFNDNLKFVPFTFVPSGSYATNGDSFTAAQLPTGVKDYVSTWAFPCPGGISFQIDVANLKLKAFGTTATGVPVETANGTNLQTALGSSAITIFFIVR